MGKNVYDSIKSDFKKSKKKLKKGYVKSISKSLPLHKRPIYHSTRFFNAIGLRWLAKQTYKLLE